MKTILITGMSGVGKTTTILELQVMGYKTADLDCDPYSVWVDAESDPEHADNEVKPGKDWVWDEPRIRELLAMQEDELLFVSGCASNMSKFYSNFASIILLTAPEPVIIQRLASRQAGTYGHSPQEMARVLRLKQTIEPMLRRAADLEIDTSTSVQSTIALILRHIGGSTSPRAS
ncbi:MAG TPA: AAA family ATPase [Puia sp.]